MLGHVANEGEDSVNDIVFKASGISYSYPGGAAVLNEISFEVRQGERAAILGANASGKSTLLHLLDGLYFPSEGRIEAFGRELTEEGVETPPFSREFRQKVGFLFQNSDAQLFCSTVEEELAFGPLQLGLSAEEVEHRVDETLRLFGVEHLRRRSPGALSGGEKKKIALAGLVTCSPEVILLDEPSAGLDPRTQQWLVEFLEVLHKAGMTFVTCTHDLGFAADVADRALVLSEDHGLAYDGPLNEALDDLDLLLSVNLIHAHAHLHDGEIHEHPHMHDLTHEHRHMGSDR